MRICNNNIWVVLNNNIRNNNLGFLWGTKADYYNKRIKKVYKLLEILAYHFKNFIQSKDTVKKFWQSGIEICILDV